MDDICVGCIWLEYVCYDLFNSKEIKECPCGLCIVKPMCKDPCNTWGLWYAIEHAKKERRGGWI
jgi:hypothetical protein